MKVRKTTIEIIAALLALLFVYAALSKVLQYDTFIYQISKSPYIENMANTVAWALPAGEILICIALAIPKTRLLGLYASFAILLMFTSYIYMMLNFAYYVPCSCGGILNNLSWQQHLIFNIFFTLLALTGILLTVIPPKQKRTIPIPAL